MTANNSVAYATLPELLTTAEFAKFERSAEQTIRKNFCLKGHHHGIVPIKLPGGRLRWRTLEVVALLNGGAK